MMDKFWESLGSDLAGEWLRRAFSPPFLFWLSGLLFYVLRYGWQELWHRLIGLQTVEQIALLILLLLGLILSSLLTARWRFTLLRWLEGYWPRPLRRLEPHFSARQSRKLEKAEYRLNELLHKPELSPEETRRRAELELFVHYYPADPAQIRPTQLGNILRAGETASAQKYGLDALVCWPRLWPLLPETLRADLITVRTQLLNLAEIWGMGFLSFVWIVWSPWAVVLAALWTWSVYRMMLPVAMSYADMIESAFDLYRFRLYEALHWPLPEAGKDESAHGQALTEFLWRGTTPQEAK